MLPYTSSPPGFIKEDDRTIPSFLQKNESNIDWNTVNSFGEEWRKFDFFTSAEIEQIGKDYFDLITPSILPPHSIVLDVGCGSGRWIKYVAPRVQFVEAIDPSQAILSASRFITSSNVRFTQASVDSIPFSNNTFDFIYSLGVLHHVPETEAAIKRCYEKLKPGGWFLIYLYYNLDNRNVLYRLLFHASNLLRAFICRLPGTLKRTLSDIIAGLIYWPLAKLSLVFSTVSTTLADAIPLAYYRKTSFRIMRNDSLDRFGTPLEKRFSQHQMEALLISAGFVSIQFSQRPPYWHAIARKP